MQACVEQQRVYGRARYLIADDVDLGKTLSMGAATLVLSLLVDKPVPILAPSTLVWQWQTELEDMLGLPSCFWGRIQRIGQARDVIDVMNLRYAGTVEDEVYAALSECFRDIFDVLGQLPDSFEEDWIGAVIEQRASARHFVTRVDTVRSPVERRYYRDIADDRGLDWEYCDRVLADRDIAEYMRRPW